MGFRRGVQAEVLLSLALVMVTGTALLAGFFLELSHARIEALHGLLGKGLVAEAEVQTQVQKFRLDPIEGSLWWRIDSEGCVTGLNAPPAALDATTRSFAEQSLAVGEALVESGAPWAAIRFAVPDLEAGEVVTGRIDAPVSGAVIAALVVINVLIF